MQPTQEMIDAAKEAAYRFALQSGIPILTADDTSLFLELGVDLSSEIGKPFGISFKDYKEYREKKAEGQYFGPDLDFMMDILTGKHLNETFLVGCQ